MKKILLLIICSFIFISCNKEGIYNRLDNKILKDDAGNYYLLKHDFGNEYLIIEVKDFKKF